MTRRSDGQKIATGLTGPRHAVDAWWRGEQRLGERVPGQDRRGSDQEDRVPAAPGEQRGQRGEPEPIRWAVPDLAGDLAPEDGVLVPEHEQLRVLGDVTAQQHRRNGQQSPGQLVQQRHDHQIVIPMASLWRPDQARRLSERHR
jgi:hypothetical protein